MTDELTFGGVPIVWDRDRRGDYYIVRLPPESEMTDEQRAAIDRLIDAKVIRFIQSGDDLERPTQRRTW